MGAEIKKKILAVLLIAAVMTQVTACGQKAAGGEDDKQRAGESAQSAEKGTETQATDDKAVSMGRYMEKSYPLPEGDSLMARSLERLSDGRLAYFDGEAGLWASQDEGSSWENVRRVPSELTADGGYMGTSAIAPDGSIAAGCYYFDDDENMESKVFRIDPEGNVISAKSDFDGDWVTGVYFRNEDELYAVTLKGKVLLFDTEGRTLKQLFIAADHPQGLEFSGKKLLALEDDGVEIYDLEQGILTDSDPVLDDFCRENISGKLNHNSDSVGAILLTGEEGVIYLAYDGGLYRHVLGGNALEQLIDGNFSVFGDPTAGICDLVLLPSGEFLLLTSREEMIRFTYDAGEPTVPEIQLKVFSMEENSRLRQVISLYQKQNPDVYVSYETGRTEGSAVTAQDALKNLNVELMSGSGPDVILMDGIDVSVYADKGMLKDLKGILDGLTGDDEALANIAGYAETEQGTFVIPAAFQIPLICGKKEDIDRVSDLESLADVVEELRGSQPDGSVTGCYSALQTLSQLMPLAEGTFLDGKRFNREAVAGFLTQANRIYHTDKKGLSDYEKEIYGAYGGSKSAGPAVEYLGTGQSSISFGLAMDMLGDIGALEKAESMGYEFSLMKGEDGAGFVPVNQVAIAANSGHMAQAEAFVKLMLSYESQKVHMYGGFPVTAKALDEICEGIGMAGQSIGSSWRLEDGTDAYFSFEYPTKEFAARFREIAAQVTHNLEGNALVKEAVLKYGVQALEGTQDMEAAVEDIRKAVSLYLAE